jgi:peptide/nickel transport system permease protein/oligopeptide transport system permease protein
MEAKPLDSGKSAVASAKPEPATERHTVSPWAMRLKRNRPAVISALALVVIGLLVLSWPATLKIAGWCGPAGAAWAQRHTPNQLSDEQFQPPSVRHWFGTDVHGRDLFSRILYGAQLSLLVGLVGAAVSLVIGVSWGAAAGYIGGRLDSVLMRTVDMLYSLPTILFVIVLITTLEGCLKRWFADSSPAVVGAARVGFLVIGLGAFSWLTMARIVRGQVLSLRRRPFVEASRALGAGRSGFCSGTSCRIRWE